MSGPALRRLSTAARSHAALAHSTWFRVADQGMTDLEVLAQGSAFLTQAPSGAHFALLSAHVAAPHRWRRYFSAGFLDFVLDDHCETRVEVRSPAGEFVTGRVLSAPLADGFADPQRDVAAFCAPANPDAPVLPLADVTVSAGAPVAVHGHILLGDEGAGGVVPTVVEGEIITTDGPRAFIDTGKDACEMGMCGGPVLTETGECAGILEGVVPRLGDGEEPLSDLHARIAGSAAFIGADELRLFLADVERTIAQTQEGGAR